MNKDTKKNKVHVFEQIKHTYLQAIGSRIMCELNDLKRTPESAAKELSIHIKVCTLCIQKVKYFFS